MFADFDVLFEKKISTIAWFGWESNLRQAKPVVGWLLDVLLVSHGQQKIRA